MKTHNNFNNIFIAISPSHISNFEEIIKNDLHEGDTVLLNPGNFQYNDNLWSVAINGTMNLSYNVSSSIKKIFFQLKKVIGYKNYLKKVKLQLSFESTSKFYYCNLDDILTNHIFSILKTYNCTFYIVEDGILNYYNPIRLLSTLNFKKKLCRVFNLYFEVIKNHPTNIYSEKVQGQYVRLPKKSICPEKSMKLPFKKLSYKPISNVVLIIGQDIMHNCIEGEVYYKTRLNTLFEKIKNQLTKEQKVVYKPHRNGDIRIAKKLLINNFEEFELFIDNTPIEDCIYKIAPLKIYSFESSAILNLKIALSDSLIYFAILPFNDQNKDVIGLYQGLEIDILK